MAGARASEMRPMPVSELSAKADLVVNGKVLAKSSQRDDSGRIYTKIQLEVNDVWKGAVSSNSITIVHGGGTVGNERTEVSGQVEFEVGEEVVAFLVLNQRGEGVCLGLSQGKFHVWKDDASGEKLAHNPFHGSRPSESNRPAALPSGSSPAKARLTLADLKRQVQGGSK
jgi:hypothetical protein